jgi:hypothetical protein
LANTPIFVTALDGIAGLLNKNDPNLRQELAHWTGLRARLRPIIERNKAQKKEDSEKAEKAEKARREAQSQHDKAKREVSLLFIFPSVAHFILGAA